MTWENARVGDPLVMPDYIERLKMGLMAYTWKGVFLCFMIPVLVVTYEFILNQSTVVVEAKVLEIHEPAAPGDFSGHRDLRYLVDFEVTTPDGQKQNASILVENDQVRTGEVGLGKPLSLLYNPNFPGNSYRMHQLIFRWIYTVIAGVFCGVLVILVVVASLVREYQWAKSS